MKKNLLILVPFLLFLWGCNCSPCSCDETKSSDESYGSSDYLINATLWYQHSAELRACYYQAFNYAKLALEKNLKSYNGDKPPAIVLDLDETVLDNSAYQADLIFNQITYNPENWKEWTDLECAAALPGSIDFIEFAEKTGVEIFYISNRRTNEIESTFSNMQKLGYPEIPIENFIFRDAESGKTARRDIVRENYEIILLLGDNLNDFSGIFEDRSVNYGFEAVDQNIEMFGTKYIVFPNPMYGSWERILYSNPDISDHKNRMNSLVGTEKACK